MLTTMLNTMTHVLSDDMVEYPGRSAAPAVDTEILGFGPLYRLYEAADRWVFLAAPSEREWTALTGVLEGMGDDPRFATEALRHEHADALAAELAERFRARAAEDWEAVMSSADVACVVVEDGPPELCIMEGEAALARRLDLLVSLEHPVIGEYERMKPLAQLSRTPGIARGAPLLGQDTDRVLHELGYSAEQVADLRARGIAVG
jgi:crotonobetainyl-CoA:carnitine CoA-transferase CaiB-like acyl-CoA transferase